MQRALYTRDMLKMVNSIEKLPTLPSIYNELTEMIIRECDVQKISQLIERDPTISASVLKVANSAYYGRRTGTLSNAIMNIGLQDLKHIVITHAVLDLVSEDEVTFKRLWKQASLSNKILTGFYLEVLKKPVPELYASAGLLHNIGRLIFVANEIDYKGLVESNRSEQEICQLEKENFGICHQDLGGFLLNNWDLPFVYVEAEMYHHRPIDFRIINSELVSVVHIAHHFTEVLTGKKNHIINPVVFELLSVEEKDVNEFIESVKEKL
jgi:HD-like signal output (HDOD) protein